MGKDNSSKMVSVPKLRVTYCNKLKRHALHKVSQYKKGKERTRSKGRRTYDRKQAGYGGQTKPISRERPRSPRRPPSSSSASNPRARGSGFTEEARSSNSTITRRSNRAKHTRHLPVP